VNRNVLVTDIFVSIFLLKTKLLRTEILKKDSNARPKGKASYEIYPVR